ncbi:hypothetical protein ABK040_005407 [Willaertia magna]
MQKEEVDKARNNDDVTNGRSTDEVICVKFVKMQGLGNDYIYVDLIDDNLELNHYILNNKINIKQWIENLCHRNFGIGGDGVIFIKKPMSNWDLPIHGHMDMFNSDGTRSEMCGNGLRCVAQYLCDKLFKSDDNILKEIWVESNLGKNIYHCFCKPKDELISYSKSLMVEIEMGTLDKYQMKELDWKSNWHGKEIGFPLYCLNVPNPHAVCLIHEIKENLEVEFDKFPVETLGSPIEIALDVFPNRTNVEFVQVVDEVIGEINFKDEIIIYSKQRTWERGTGETFACGTGAFAVSQVLYRHFGEERNGIVCIELKGGKLYFRYKRDGNSVNVFNDWSCWLRF